MSTLSWRLSQMVAIRRFWEEDQCPVCTSWHSLLITGNQRILPCFLHETSHHSGHNLSEKGTGPYTCGHNVVYVYFTSTGSMMQGVECLCWFIWDEGADEFEQNSLIYYSVRGMLQIGHVHHIRVVHGELCRAIPLRRLGKWSCLSSVVCLCVGTQRQPAWNSAVRKQESSRSLWADNAGSAFLRRRTTSHV